MIEQNFYFVQSRPLSIPAFLPLSGPSSDRPPLSALIIITASVLTVKKKSQCKDCSQMLQAPTFQTGNLNLRYFQNPRRLFLRQIFEIAQ